MTKVKKFSLPTSLEQEELLAYGFKIEKKQPWHWRISKPDYDIVLDVWPTVRKYWIVGTPSNAGIYDNFLEKIFGLFNNYMP